MENNRGSFGSKLGFLLAAVGSAVGLGNIWGFPYKMGSNGGFAFLLVYLVLAIFVGLAVMVGELFIGRKTGLSPLAAYKKLSKKFTWLGWLALISPFVVLGFYFVLGGIVTRYAVSYLTAIFGWNTWGVPQVTDFFGHFICAGSGMLVWTAIFVAINGIVVAAGVAEGIEKFCKIGMPALFVMLVAVIIYVAVQPGAFDGYKFMFGWNIEPLKEDFLGVLSSAAGQMFFSLSLGMGIMITYGSYLDKKENIQQNSVLIVVCDTLVAILAGMIVMPACFAFLDGNVRGGPGLLFASMQEVFFKMGGIGNLMGFLFYGLVFIAAISSSMSLLEVLISATVDMRTEKKKAPGRKKAVLVWCIIILIISLPVALDGLGSGTAAGCVLDPPAVVFGSANVAGWNDCWLDFYDLISEGILMPLGSAIMAFAIGWIWKLDMVVKECELEGNKFWGKGFFNICFKVITPIGMLFVIYGQITGFFGL